MEERIGFIRGNKLQDVVIYGLNPYCNGRKNRIIHSWGKIDYLVHCLNPYCNGRKNRINS